MRMAEFEVTDLRLAIEPPAPAAAGRSLRSRLADAICHGEGPIDVCISYDGMACSAGAINVV
jgi:hypothetical protein